MSLPKRIILGVSGGIAAYKSAQLLRCLQKAGATVRVVMTASAKAFVQPLTFQALSGHPVYDQLLDDQTDNGMAHIELAKWAELVVIAPASANCLAKLAYGFADDLLSTLVLATSAPVAIAPAMNQQMWSNQQVQSNVEHLQQFGRILLQPEVGEQACGDHGAGRMMEPKAIVEKLQTRAKPAILSGQHWVITAGPTQEAIDPVRYISNHSSGKMGFALATAAIKLGARVTLVAGPVHLETPDGVDRVDVVTALEMRNAVFKAMPGSTGLIAAAAVADYRIKQVSDHKIKKTKDISSLSVVVNPDIVAEAARAFPDVFVAGFALETDNLIAFAQQKLQSKGLALIIANQLQTDTFGGDKHSVTVLTCDGDVQQFARTEKTQLAYELLHYIHSYRQQQLVRVAPTIL